MKLIFVFFFRYSDERTLLRLPIKDNIMCVIHSTKTKRFTFVDL